MPWLTDWVILQSGPNTDVVRVNEPIDGIATDHVDPIWSGDDDDSLLVGFRVWLRDGLSTLVWRIAASEPPSPWELPFPWPDGWRRTV